MSILAHKTARIISYLFVPPSITLIIFTYFAFKLEDEISHTFTVVFVAFLFGFILPVITYVLLQRKGYISNFDATIKEERIFPFIIGIIIYLFGFLLLLLNNINIIILSFWFCYISNTLLIILITKHWKISAHAFGVSGPLGAITFVLGWTGMVFIILLLLVCWSRIKLKVHTISQVIAGSIAGFVLTYFQMFLLSKYF